MRSISYGSVVSSTFALSIVTSVALLAGTSVARALVHVAIDLTHQRMHVESDEGTYDWPISSARSGFYTPGGSFAPTHLELMHYSKKYHMSPMPHAIFFRGGYAIHGTYSTASLGRPASHGCVRLSPGDATILYEMVKAEGARIAISGTPPASRPFAIARRERSRGAPDAYASSDGQDYGDTPYVRARPSSVDRGYYYGQAGGYGYAYTQQPYYSYPYGAPAVPQSPLIPGFDE